MNGRRAAGQLLSDRLAAPTMAPSSSRRPLFFTSWRSAIVCTALAVVVSSGVAADGKTLIEDAYEKTKTAKSLEDFESIIGLCEEAQNGELSPTQDTYVKSLLSWAVNRRGEAYTEQAASLHGQGEKQPATDLDGKALADFERAIQLDPTRWKPWHNRGVSYAIAGKYQQALEDFSKVIELNPKYSNAWFNRGEIQFDLGQYAQALKDYSEAIRLNPNDAGAYTSRAHTQFRLGAMNEAIADYSKAIELSPDAAAYANRGEAYQSLRQWEQAAEDLRQALQLDSESPRVLQSVAWLMATCPDDAYRNSEMAVQAAEKAVERSSQPDALYLDTLAAAYANAGSFDKAIAKAKEALGMASAQDAALIKARLAGYQQQTPYRQPTGEASAAPNATPQGKSSPTRKATAGKSTG